jgi:hypothetical protein
MLHQLGDLLYLGQALVPRVERVPGTKYRRESEENQQPHFFEHD